MNNLSADEDNGASIESFMKAFNKRYPTLYDCVRELRYKAIGVYDLICACGSKNVKGENDRKMRCLDCGKSTWLLAETFFHGIRRPRQWLALIEMFLSGVFVNSYQFQQAVRIAYSSALSMFKKLTMVIASYMGDGEELPSHLFLEAFCKRSKRTPAGQHPRSEEEGLSDIDLQTTARDQSQGEDLVTNIAVLDERNLDPSLSAVEIEVLDLLTPEPIHFDRLCERTELSVGTLLSSLTLLELSGRVLRLSSDRYVLIAPLTTTHDVFTDGINRIETALPSDAMELAANIVQWIKGCFHGVSRKYLQNYLAAYWCARDRATWNASFLAQACLEADAISDREILGYVTPPVVRVIG